MDHYLLTARSITHVQRMAQMLERSGIYVKIRRVGSGISKSGCGYTLQVSARQYALAVETLRAGGAMPVKAFHVTGEARQEVAL